MISITRKQRFMTALRGEVPDIVPVAPLIHHRFAHRILGRSDWRTVFEVHQMLGSIHFRGPLGVGLLSSLPEGYGMEWREVESDPSGRVTTEWAIRTPKRTLKGRIVRGMIPNDPLCSKTVEYPVKGVEDWLAYLDLRLRWLENAGEPIYDAVSEAVELMGDDGIASVGLMPAFSVLAEVRGMEGILLDLFDRPDLIEELLEVERQIMEKHVDAFISSPAEVAWLDICWATGANMGPKKFERWSLPDVVRAMEKVRGIKGKYLGLYTLGRIRNLLPMLVETGVHFIETFEPNQGDIPLSEAKRLYGDRICIMGNFDCLVLSFGTVEEAREETRRCLREGMEGGGYVLVTADEVPADAKWENLRAMVETVEREGRYT